MRDLEQALSILIDDQFPSFYKEEGENLIAFVKAYYEWLERNHQQLVVTSNTNFNVGDTLYQGNTTGTIVSVSNNSIIAAVTGFDTFRCNHFCNDYTPLTSSSGGDTHIERQRKLAPHYYARKLFNIGDIDRTLDEFVLHFKEKYLKNIEFTTASNKQLLVKNSLNLYRSKGTERSIDLFFRLVYGESAKVYYPADDLFTLSAAQWYKPRYLEITKSRHTVNLVGKQIIGLSSGATAFVEKYVKRRINNGFVYMLYLSNIEGTFVKGEILKDDQLFSDLPRVLGSLTHVQIITGSSDFAVGDIVNITSAVGEGATARVASIEDSTGLVDFELVDGGYGYTDTANLSYSGGELAKRTQSIVSEKVITLSNVVASNTAAAFLVHDGGTGYSNTDVVSVPTYFTDAVGQPTTNSTGGIEYITILNNGSGLYSATPNVSIANSTGGASSGSGANVSVDVKRYPTYFKYFDTITQCLVDITYDTASNNELLVPGARIHIGNTSVNNAFGIIISNANNTLVNANGVLTVALANNTSFGAGNTIFLTSNTSISANVGSFVNTYATGVVMGVPTTAEISIRSINGTFNAGDEIYAIDNANVEVANAVINSRDGTEISSVLFVEDMTGVFNKDAVVYVRNKTSNAVITSVSLTVGVYDIGNTFTFTSTPQIFASITGTVGNVVSISTGNDAGFKISNINDSETVYLNTDLLSGNNEADVSWVDVALNATQYDFPKSNTANSEDVILSTLTYEPFTIGSIGALSRINQGEEYNVDPYSLQYQPYVTSKHDYRFDISNTSGSFVPGEYVVQTQPEQVQYTLTVDDDAGFEVGMQVVQGSANGIVVDLDDSANTVTVENVQGVFDANATTISSFSNTSIAATITNVSTSNIAYTAIGKVKSANATVINIQRLQYDNLWSVGNTITGQSGGATAIIESVNEDINTTVIGLNGNISSDATAANGTVTELEIIDSGLGYRDNDEVYFVSVGGGRSGTAIANAESVGTGAGYYKTTKGFLSSESHLQDGNYWQEYSYEILSRIPLDKYSEMFKKVMHTSGTRFFGGIALESVSSAAIIHADSSITAE